SRVASAFPNAAVNVVQLTRLGVEGPPTCEAVGRVEKMTGDPSEGVAIATKPKLVFTGLQIGFRDQDADIRLACDRLNKELVSQGANSGDVIFWSTYSLSRAVAAKAIALRTELLKNAKAGSALMFEGLPSLDATAAIEAVANR